MKRQRGRNRSNNNKNNNPNRSMDSNGPDVKVRGNANTIYEKYVQLARDATSNGSRVKAENYLQHAEHYLRLVNVQEAEKKAREEEREAQQAARRAQNSVNESGGDDGNQNRRSRRHERRPRNAEPSNNDGSASAETADQTSKPEDTPAGLEVVKPAAEDAPKRRRAAPKRKEKPEEAIDAAE